MIEPGSGRPWSSISVVCGVDSPEVRDKFYVRMNLNFYKLDFIVLNPLALYTRLIFLIPIPLSPSNYSLTVTDSLFAERKLIIENRSLLIEKFHSVL